MKHRLYLPSPLELGAAITLDAERSHYVTRVLRAPSEIYCFDGSGCEFRAHITATNTKACVLELVEQHRVETKPAEDIHLALGLLKGSAMDRAIQKSTELGATDIWPIQAERSNTNLPREQKKHRHWQRIIESAAEQSHRLFLPVLHEPLSLKVFLASSVVAQKLFLDIGQQVFPAVIPRQSTVLLTGPEGGWSASERELARDNGATGFSLGEYVLRAETAPLAALAALHQAWRWR